MPAKIESPDEKVAERLFDLVNSANTAAAPAPQPPARPAPEGLARGSQPFAFAEKRKRRQSAFDDEPLRRFGKGARASTVPQQEAKNEMNHIQRAVDGYYGASTQQSEQGSPSPRDASSASPGGRSGQRRGTLHGLQRQESFVSKTLKQSEQDQYGSMKDKIQPPR